MKQRSNIEFIVGLFALAGFAVIIYLSTVIHRAPVSGGTGAYYHAIFDTVSGLEKDTPVEMAGIIVGSVSKIDLEKNRAKITIDIRKDITLRQNASLSIKDRGILGDKILILEPGDPSLPILPPGSTISNTRGKSDLDRLVKTLADASKDIKEITGIIRDFMNRENEQRNMDAILKNFRQVSKNLSRATESIERLSTRNEEKVAQLIENLRSTVETVRLALENKDKGMKQSLEKINEAMNSLAEIMKKIESGDGTIGKLVNDEKTVDNINEAVESINDFLSSARKIQTSFLYRGEYLFDSEELQNLVGVYIQTRPDKFFLFEMVDAPQGQTRITDTVVTTPPNDTVIAHTQTIKTDDNILLSFEFGKRFYDLTFRFGLIRNEGGVGMDYHFLNDIVKISIEAFNFDRYDNRPQVRLFGSLQLYKNFLVAAGVNDLVDKGGNRDPFVGGGIFFTDNDLKSLLSAVSLPGF